MQLDEPGRILRPRADDAAWAVVLEGARDRVLTGGEKGGGDRVTLETLDLAPLEGEADGPGAVDTAERGVPVGRLAHRASPS